MLQITHIPIRDSVKLSSLKGHSNDLARESVGTFVVPSGHMTSFSKVNRTGFKGL